MLHRFSVPLDVIASDVVGALHVVTAELKHKAWSCNVCTAVIL